MNGAEFVIGVLIIGALVALTMLDYFETKRQDRADENLKRALNYGKRNRT